MKLGNSATRNPVLCTVENVAVAFVIGAGRHFCGRTSSSRFGDADRRFVAAQNMFRRQFFLNF